MPVGCVARSWGSSPLREPKHILPDEGEWFVGLSWKGLWTRCGGGMLREGVGRGRKGFRHDRIDCAFRS